MAAFNHIPLGLKRRTFLLAVSALATGCGGGGGESEEPPEVSSPPPQSADPRLAKGDVWVPGGKETAVVVFNGEVIAITFQRGWATFEGNSIVVRRWATGEVIATKPWTGAMGCAIVKDGAIHIFGNTNWRNPGNKIIHSVLAPDFTPSAPTDALLMNAPASPFKFYNTSVTADPNGYRMVVETTAGVYFARSTDLNSWTWAGGQLAAGIYIGCPSIHYIAGAHYLTWLAQGPNGTYETRVAKSTDDCFTFIYGKTLMVPGPADGSNTSDLDMVEFDGEVCGVYLDGDQTTYANLRKWTYHGTLAQMFAEHV